MNASEANSFIYSWTSVILSHLKVNIYKADPKRCLVHTEHFLIRCAEGFQQIKMFTSLGNDFVIPVLYKLQYIQIYIEYFI